MSSNKYMKKKILPPFIMGQRNATATSSQSNCSIFSVDEDVQIVVENGDDAVFSAMPLDKNLELAPKTYSKRNPLSFPCLMPSTEPFEFSVIPEDKSLSSSSLQCTSSANPKRKRGVNEQLETVAPRKISKTDVAAKEKSVSIRTRESRPRQKPTLVDNDVSSDSDIEVVEIKVVNPNALNSITSVMRRSIKKENDSKNIKKVNGVNVSKKTESTPKQLQVSKSCYNKLIVQEADTAPFIPNNPNTFPDVLASTKWLNISSTTEKSNKASALSKGEPVENNSSSPVEKKLSLIQEVSIADVKTLKNRSELKCLYQNLGEISWTQDASFKKLLRNPDYIRHSDRSSSRNAENGEVIKKVRPTSEKPDDKSGVKKIARIRPNFKNNKLVTTNIKNKLVATKIKNKLINAKINKLKLAPKSKINKLSVNKLSKAKYRKNQLSKVAKVSLKSCKQSKASKDGVKVKFAEPKAKKNINTELKIKKSPSEQVAEKGAKQKSLQGKKSEKPFEKAKSDTPKTNGDVRKKPSILAADKMLLSSKAKVENSKASGSSAKRGPSTKCLSDPCIMCSEPRQGGSIEKPNQQRNLYSKRLEMLQEYNMKDYLHSAVQRGSQCRVNIEPLEHSSLRNTEYYDDFRKQYLHQALRKAMEKREPNYIATVIQEFCDSFMSPTTEDKVTKKRKKEEESLRSSARQIGGALRYKEIVVKKLQNYMQVILVPNGIKKNSLSIEAIKELRDVFLLAKKDPKCRAVLLSSSGSYFCTGIDLSQLVGPNKKQACEEMASVIRELVLVLSAFTKPIMAAVNGAAVGFGVSLLTYCDIVLASDKATFCVPSLSIGYMPEGGLTLTLPQIIGNVRCCEMLLQGSKFTASQAHQKGLVSEVLWPSRFMNEVMPRLMSVISQPLPVMEATKLLVRANIWDKLRSHMDVERRLLVNHWLTPQCQENMKRFLRMDSLID